MLENPEGGRRITELPEKYRGATENGNRAPEKSQPKSGFGPEAGSEAQTRLEVTETKIGHLIEAVTEGLNSPYAAQSLKDLEAQAATDKATIERLRALPSLATVLPHPAMLVQRALDLQEMFRHGRHAPFAGREALRRLLGDQSVVLRPIRPVTTSRRPRSSPCSHSIARAAEKFVVPGLVARGGFEPPTFGS